MKKNDLGNFIKLRRQKLNISQSDLADYFDISIQAIYKWEKGQSSPDFVILGELSEILKISIDDLFALNIDAVESTQTNKFDYNQFGLTIKKYMDYYKLSQKQLSSKTKISQSTISNIINQKAYPTINQFIALVNFFNVSFADLYFSNFNLQAINPIKKNTPQKHKINKKLILFMLLLIVFISTFFIDSNDSYNEIVLKNNDIVVEFWDQNDKLINSQKLEYNQKAIIPDYYTNLGWNKMISPITSSTIYKENKNPHALILRVHQPKGTSTHYYDSIKDFNIWEITSATHYCTQLYDENNNIFDINNLNNNYYTLTAQMEPRKTHSIIFPSELNLESITIKDAQRIPQLPIIGTNDYIIKDYEYNKTILKPKDPYSFEQTIIVNPIYHNQKTTINSEGFITYLSSQEETIVIPDSINGITVKGINPASIELNQINNSIIFLNKNVISFESPFINNTMIDNIKTIEIHENSFTNNSYLGNISSLDKIYVNCGDQVINFYSLRNISKSEFNIKKLEYYYRAHAIMDFQNLTVDEVTCLDADFTHVIENMFANSTLNKITFKSTLKNLSIHDSAFMNCYNLKEIRLPDKTMIFGEKQFYNCKSLENIEFLGSIESFSNNMFYNTKITKLTVNSTVNNISKYAFLNTSISSIEITSLNNIEDNCYLPKTLDNLYIGNYFYSPFKLDNRNTNLTIHYLDCNNEFYNTLKSSNYSICLNCRHLHKGTY